jgi:aromatic ring-opening dioxygenase catalytic subunit (LigB family)
MTTETSLPTFFIPHGGGPCFFMEWPSQPDMWNKMGDFLKSLPRLVGARPKAVVVVSGHWIQKEFTVMAAEQRPLIYDYNGFPEHTYRLTYPAPGAPELAKRIQTLLEAEVMPTMSDAERGFDHGTFIPFKLIYPDADIPIVQLSLKEGLHASEHLCAGKALRVLRDEGVLIVGSGMSFHNMRGFSPAFTDASRRFDDWLTATVSAPNPGARDRLLQEWEEAPDARLAQPHPDHLLPLMVAAGAAGADTGRKVFEDKVMNVIVSGFAFG